MERMEMDFEGDNYSVHFSLDNMLPEIERQDMGRFAGHRFWSATLWAETDPIFDVGDVIRLEDYASPQIPHGDKLPDFRVMSVAIPPKGSLVEYGLVGVGDDKLTPSCNPALIFRDHLKSVSG